MEKRVIVCVVMGLVLPCAVKAVPVIGGDPVHTEQDYFNSNDWGLTVYSYVYDETSAALPGDFILNTGEMLFMYLLDADGTKTSSVEYFSVENPDELPINTVGCVNSIIPTGYDSGKYQAPVGFDYSGFSKTISYYFAGGYKNTIEPDEWSLVYYIAASDYWAGATGAVAAAGSDEHNLPAPALAPEPATIVLFGLGALLLGRRRR